MTQPAPLPETPAWRSKKFWLASLAIASWTYLLDAMIREGVGRQSEKIAIPAELWWAMMIKGSVEVLAIGGQAALDAYTKQLPFSAPFRKTPPTVREESPPEPRRTAGVGGVPVADPESE